jgi:hypothetical protein
MANSWNESGTTWNTNRWGTTNAITAGWGADAWNTGGSWGQATDELIILTGISATVSLGDTISGANQGWGRAGWSEESYGESDNPVITLTGLEAIVSLGDSVEFNETGWGRLAWGQADWGEGADETVSLSGFELTASPGSINTEVAYLLETTALTTSLGTPEVEGEIGVPITGVSAEFATPTLAYVGHTVGWGRNEWGEDEWGESPDEVITLVGRSMEAVVSASNSWGENTWSSNEVWGGTFDITIEIGVPITGVSATTSVGSVTFVISPTVSLDGQSATTAVDDLGLAFGASTEPIGSISATVSVGTLGLEFGPSQITGVSATASVGELEVVSVEIASPSGVSATVSVGSIVPAIGVPLTGIAATSAVGSISLVDVTQGLIGIELTSSVGLIGIQSYATIDTGSNTSYTSVATGSNTSYSDVA